MRLIDKDKLLEAIAKDSKGNAGKYGDEWLFMDTIENAPIITAYTFQQVETAIRTAYRVGRREVDFKKDSIGSKTGFEMRALALAIGEAEADSNDE